MQLHPNPCPSLAMEICSDLEEISGGSIECGNPWCLLDGKKTLLSPVAVFGRSPTLTLKAVEIFKSKSF